MSDNSPCPLCSRTLVSQPRPSERYLDGTIYDCPLCGRFLLNGMVTTDERFNESKHLIIAWIHRQHKSGIDVPIVALDVVGPGFGIYESILQIGLPTVVNEKLDILLKTYADIAKDEYGKIVKIGLHPNLILEVAAKNEEEINSLNQYLIQLGYIEKASTDVRPHIRMTAQGWARIDELTRTVFSSNSAFIAVWYDSCTERYRQTVTSAVSNCGYKPLIVDQVEFNNFIMDEVVSLIRSSRFTIVDLTSKPEIDDHEKPKVLQGVRGGVYWESGMAYGMGKPVIQTCRKDDESKRRVHFDLDQYQTIFWEDENLDTSIRDLSNPIANPNFAEKLAQRILTTVGRGTYIP